MGGGGSSHPIDNSVAPEVIERTDTPNLFKPAQQYMPEEYFANRQIHDPSSILNAYIQHMPDFLAGTKSQSYYPSSVPKPTPALSGGSPQGFIRRSN